MSYEGNLINCIVFFLYGHVYSRKDRFRFFPSVIVLGNERSRAKYDVE